MTFIPAQQVLLETDDWTEFKASVITQKGLTLSFLEYPTYYDIRAVEAAHYRIVLQKGTPDALDFEENYKAGANQRYDLRVVLVTTGGVPTISAIGEDAPPGAARTAGIGTDGKLRSFTIEPDGRMSVNALVVFSSYKTTYAAVTTPPPDPIVPAGGPWYYLGQAAVSKETATLCWFWGAL